jgi:hypothetical protein
MYAGERPTPELEIESVMPPHFDRDAQEPAALQQEVTDYYVVSGGLRVGRVYKRESGVNSDRQWFWDISGVHPAPGVMGAVGTTATFEEAEENWDKWLAWAKLREISGATPPPALPRGTTPGSST